MGAQAFAHEITAKSAQEGYQALVKEAQYEYGHAAYNGTISTCSMGKCKLAFSHATPENLEKAYAFVEDVDYGEKWTAHYVDLGVDTKAKTKHKYLFYGLASC